MKIVITSLGHLPSHKREELKEITSIIKENADVEMIILFGSYARGNWAEDIYTEGHVTHEYRGDFDILVIVKTHPHVRKLVLWRNVETLVRRSSTIQTRLTLIVHDLKEVNSALARRQYFFTDIKNCRD